MSKYYSLRDGGYPPGVTGGDPHFDMPSVGDYGSRGQAIVRILRNQLHCDHTWQLRVHKFTNDFMSYKQCIKCGRLADIEIHYRKDKEEEP